MVPCRAPPGRTLGCPSLGGNGNKAASSLTSSRYSSLGGSQACRPQPTRPRPTRREPYMALLSVLPDYLISNIVSRVAMHDESSGWSLGRHYRQCGQSCPCCRFAAGDGHGYSAICSQGQHIAIVSSSFRRLVMGMPYTWRPFTARTQVCPGSLLQGKPNPSGATSST